MFVSLLVSATTYPLAGEVGVSERVHSPAADFRVDPRTEQQVISRVRAAAATVLDRGNLLYTVTFSTTRKFATPEMAAAFALNHDNLIPRSGILVFKSASPGGFLSEHRMAGAVISPPRRNTVGATVFLDYVVTGGAITEITAPPSGVLLLDSTGTPVLTATSEFIYIAA